MLSLAHKRNGTDRFLVERITQLIPGWGVKQLTLDTLEKYCATQSIICTELPLIEADGYAFYQHRIPHIYYSSRLPYPQKVITGYHELCHILIDAPDPEMFKRQNPRCWNFNKWDRKAEIVGVVAWMPETRARGLSVEELMREFDVSRDSAEFRASLNLWRLT